MAIVKTVSFTTSDGILFTSETEATLHEYTLQIKSMFTTSGPATTAHEAARRVLVNVETLNHITAELMNNGLTNSDDNAKLVVDGRSSRGNRQPYGSRPTTTRVVPISKVKASKEKKVRKPLPNHKYKLANMGPFVERVSNNVWVDQNSEIFQSASERGLIEWVNGALSVTATGAGLINLYRGYLKRVSPKEIA